MVVGGGIAGMQASLDAAAAGYKVYLVERDISIGGVMAQLDKTFPTNDCSTCLISPKLIEVAQHPDIEILTQAEVRRLEGEAGRFTVTLHREPRYIDAAKCNACGACAEVCPVSLPSTFDEGMGQRHAAFRHFPQAVPSTFAIKKFDRAPCVRACPANLSAQGYVQLIKAGKYDESLKLIMDRLPLPGTIGRICPHPCESDCRRQEMDEPVAICSLKRFAADQADWDALPVPEVPQKNQAVAIVGAGPAGLSCAYHLALKGYRTVIFEAAPGGRRLAALRHPGVSPAPGSPASGKWTILRAWGWKSAITPPSAKAPASTISSPGTGLRRSSSGSGPRIPSACRSPEPRPPGSCGEWNTLRK